MESKFSKKTYEMVRNTLLEYVNVRLRDFPASALMDCLVQDFADQFADDNPRFSRDKFTKGLKEE